MSCVPSPRHVAVLLEESLMAIKSQFPTGPKILLDATYGCGNFSKAILGNTKVTTKLDVFKRTRIIACDRDPKAIKLALNVESYNAHKVVPCFTKFSELYQNSPEKEVDVVMMDIGFSSMQVDQEDRGFSYLKDGPLDMRFGQYELVHELFTPSDWLRITGRKNTGEEDMKAEDVINRFSESELITIFTKVSIFHPFD
ncbi:Ribosomal RNA small subunit methyltransferase H domain-containing protein [Rozella allomycis CSF55]|uniref:Ribosomal RNA small subunit methyltransferase H domain-containing protein n=1 Tax=Rozella allomycis (strain CSF55) TaxID=988480 RepID=A0A075B2B5_ROZAC|nr:Ribosomal RNA small subunit methyltransferase H domain-containing protein [Rozella allomycis CSF55]|eukprot:EPZ34963.1 Ribosomal RNA small subunit methyltransferase H domain-containing protein [Rozella allomycis CSF55]